MSDSNLDIGKAVSTSFEVYKDNFVNLFVAGLITFVLTITIVCAPPAVIGLYQMCIRALRGEKVEIGDLFKGFEGFLSGWGLSLIVVAGVGFGLILLVIPGIYLMVLWSVAFQALAEDRSLGAFGAIKKSQELVRGNFWPVFLVFLVIGVIGIAISLIPLGGFVVTPFFYAGGAYVYLKLKGPQAGPVSAIVAQAA